MRDTPKHKIALVLGLAFFLISPLLFFFGTQRIAKLICPHGGWGGFGCLDTYFFTGVAVFLLPLAVGALLLLWATRNSK